MQYSDAGFVGRTYFDRALQARENELVRGRMLIGIKTNDMCVSGQQLAALLQCALREIGMLREGSPLKHTIAKSLPPATPAITSDMLDSGSCLEVMSLYGHG